MNRLVIYASIVGTFATLLIVWSIAAFLLRPTENDGLILLPGPLSVLQHLYLLFVDHGFAWDIAVSVGRICLGVFLAAACAFVLGIWFGMTPTLHAAITPIFSFGKYLPPVSFIPVLILWLGTGLQQQVALLFIGTFFYLTVMVADTVGNIPTNYYHAARSLGATRTQLLFKVVIPFSFPEFIQHLRVMVGIAWTYLVVVEMVAAQNEIGRVIIDSQRYLRTADMLAGVFTIGVLGVVSDALLRGVAFLICRWK